MGLLQEVAVTTKNVAMPKGKVGKVRGLALADIGWLMEEHTTEVSQLFEGKLNMEDMVTKWPAFTAKAIAVALDEPDDWKLAAKLPVTVQLDAIMKIWDLTVLDPKILGKTFERLTSALGQLAAPAFVESINQTGKGITSKPRKGSPRAVTVGKKS